MYFILANPFRNDYDSDCTEEQTGYGDDLEYHPFARVFIELSHGRIRPLKPVKEP